MRVSCRSSRWLAIGKPKRTAVSARLGWSRLGILVRMEVISRTCSVSSGLLCWLGKFWSGGAVASLVWGGCHVFEASQSVSQAVPEAGGSGESEAVVL